MEGIKDRVAIIGMGCTKFGELWDKGVGDLIVDAAVEAFEDAGISPKDIQAAWLGTRLQEMGLSLSVPLRLQYIPVTRIDNRCCSGTDAFRNACYAVAAGIYDVVLVVGVEKLKDRGLSGAATGGAERHPVQDLGMSGGPPSMFAFRANRYFEHYGIPPQEGKEILAKIAVKNHHNGAVNPKAHFQREVSLEQVVNAPIISWPLGLFDCCPVTDGAAAAIVCRADMAKSFRDDPIFVKALAISAGPGDNYGRADFDLVHFEESVRAGQAAYKEAGISHPFKQVSLAIVHDCFTITELITYEDLGFCPRGQAKDYVNSNAFTLDGELPVNTDGGLKAFGHPIGASGLRMLYEVYKQLQGKAINQLKAPELGLTHNLGGALGGWVVSVAIIGR